MKRISQTLATIAPRYDVVVIGSGYGGGVAASRLARAGRTVCVLERGKEMLPGEYPSTLSGLRTEVQLDTELGRYGPKTALFDIRMNRDLTAVIGCGLGGTSLINANVSLEMDPALFEYDGWPRVFSKDVLEPYYQRARAMLEPNTYPTSRPAPNKMQALQTSADRIGMPFERAPINVNFVDKVNSFGVYQPACNDCGNCVSGCNFGAKNTILMNYLPDAHNHGASMFTLASVQWVQRDGAQWLVHVTSLHPSIPDTTVCADVVVLAAGSLGSTEILLRSQENGLAVSPMLGNKFSTNGDVLAFGYDNEWKQVASVKGGMVSAPVYGVGAPDVPKEAAHRPGPCITGIVDGRIATRVQDRMIIEEGSIPGALASLMPPAMFFGEATTGNPLQYGPEDAEVRLESAKQIAAALQSSPSTIGDAAYTGPGSRTQTYLVMSHDDAEGRMELRDDRLRIVWPGAGAESTFGTDAAVLDQVNAAIHGELLGNPLNGTPMGQQLVTVHPVGGCRMADDWNRGVVDDRSRVYSGEHAVYDGLYVCDGAVIAGAVAVNPSLTITALAERSMELLIEDRGWSSDLTLQPAKLGHRRWASPRPGRPAVPLLADGIGAALWHALRRCVIVSLFGLRLAWSVVRHGLARAIRAVIVWFIHHRPDDVSPGLAFTETMAGFISEDIRPNSAPPWEQLSNPFDIAAARGRLAGRTMDFHLTIATNDVHAMTVDPTHPATVNGQVTCQTLSAVPMTVTNGTFQLLPCDPDHVNTWLMIYDFALVRQNDTALHFRGTKYLRRLPGSSPWTDLTTLYTTVSDPSLLDGAGAPTVVAAGILTLDVQDFIRQAATVAVTPREKWFTRIGFLDRAFDITFLGKFVGFFGETVLQAYGALLSDLNDFDRTADAGRSRRAIKAPQPVVHKITTSDGCTLRLFRYSDATTTAGPVILAPGFSVTASSFAIDTVDENLVEFLYRHHYDVWLFAYRASPDSGSSTKAFDIDDVAQRDWPAAVAHVRQATDCDVQIVAHCVASMTLLMALLHGLSGVRSVISSQTTVHPVVGWLNDFKSDLGIAQLIRRIDLPKMGIDLRHKVDFRSSNSAADKTIDVALWTLPVPDGEQCTNPVCRRVFALWGPSYAHAQLNHETHVALREMFGPLSTVPFQQLSDIVARCSAVDAAGNDIYMPNVAKLALPIDFIAGARNLLFLPESSRRTFDWLVAHNGGDHYTRRVFAEYAHMDFWIGRRANVDIYPYVLERLQARQDSAANAS